MKASFQITPNEMSLFNKISRVAIVDDHLIFRDGFKLLLNEYKFLKMVGDYPAPEFLLKFLPSINAEIIFLDIHTEGMMGWDAVKEIHNFDPCIKVVAMTQFSQGIVVNKMLGSGICGYMVKSQSKKELEELFTKMNKGEIYISPEAEFNAKSGDPALSHKEVSIIQLLAADKDNKHIAFELDISEKTLIRDIEAICQKLGVSTIAGIISMAYKLKILI